MDNVRFVSKGAIRNCKKKKYPSSQLSKRQQNSTMMQCELVHSVNVTPPAEGRGWEGRRGCVIEEEPKGERLTDPNFSHGYYFSKHKDRP